MKKHFRYSSARQLWRILISESEKLILETRDTQTKEVFFQCFNLENAKPVFQDLQLDEKSWLGIESIYKDIIYFHHFPKRDMPTHKGIIAFDIQTQKEIWRNEDFSFHFLLNDKIYAFKQGFDDRNYASFDYDKGTLIEELGNNYQLINDLRTKAENNRDWSAYIYPEKLITCFDSSTKELIDTHVKKFEIAGEIEYAEMQKLLFFNYHQKNSVRLFTNNFCCIDKTNGNILLEETLNDNASSLFTDSFFVYKNFLFLLKEKNEIVVMCLE